METFLYCYPSCLCLLIIHNILHTALQRVRTQNKSGFCKLNSVAAFSMVSVGASVGVDIPGIGDMSSGHLTLGPGRPGAIIIISVDETLWKTSVAARV